jgi:YHS domain-containing protein
MDPVCGKTVHTDQGKTSVFDGLVYYFCSCECREIFEAAPELYVGKDRSAIGKSLEDSHV